jgi:hypothetical protein
MVGHLVDCFLVRMLWMEASSERQRMVNPRKAYPVDTGLIPIFDRTGRANTGHRLETAVLLELERRGCEVTYVRTPEGYEVDFLARYPDGTEELLQVCADPSTPGTWDREVRALVAARPRHPRAQRRILTLVREPRASAPEDIAVEPAYAWLLGPPEPAAPPRRTRRAAKKAPRPSR